MAEELQSLIEKIQRNGVECAEREAARFSPRQRTGGGDYRAGQEAGRERAAAAERQAAHSALAGTRALEQAARDVSLRRVAALGRTFQDIIGGESAAAVFLMTSCAMLIRRMLQAYAERGMTESRIEVLLSAKDQASLREALMREFAAEAKGGLEISAQDGLAAGFQLKLEDGRVTHDFSSDAIAEAISASLARDWLRSCTARPVMSGPRRRDRVAYYYLVASLPSLELDGNCLDGGRIPPRLRERAGVGRFGRGSDGAGGPGGESRNESLRRWHRARRNCETRLPDTGRRSSAERPSIPREHAGFDVGIERGVSEAVQLSNPLEREKALDLLRWRMAEEMATVEPFGLGAVLGHALELRLAGRWHSMGSNKGAARSRPWWRKGSKSIGRTQGRARVSALMPPNRHATGRRKDRGNQRQPGDRRVRPPVTQNEVAYPTPATPPEERSHPHPRQLADCRCSRTRRACGGRAGGFSGELLSVELGPGLLGQVYDGLQNPLPSWRRRCGFFLSAAPTSRRSTRAGVGVHAGGEGGPAVTAGEMLGTVPEGIFAHRIMVPFRCAGTLEGEEVAPPGEYTVEHVVAQLSSDEHGAMHEVRMMQRWPVKMPIRAYAERLRPTEPLVTQDAHHRHVLSRWRAAARTAFPARSARARPCCSRSRAAMPRWTS